MSAGGREECVRECACAIMEVKVDAAGAEPPVVPNVCGSEVTLISDERDHASGRRREMMLPSHAPRKLLFTCGGGSG